MNGRLLVALGAAMFALSMVGCTHVPLAKQRLVSKAAMSFDSSAHGHPVVNLMTQLEPGTAASGGAQAAGCTSCR
ncbi:MAG: hypothetical protein HOH58_09630 [Opitutaceae bacterium]|nr:hypothetical protein [Opitutaceae bacterium]